MMTDIGALSDVSMDALVSYTANGLSAGTTSVDLNMVQSCWYSYPVQQTSTTYLTIGGYYQPNKFEQAFKVVSHLLETGTIKDLTLKRFVALVGEVAGLL